MTSPDPATSPAPISAGLRSVFERAQHEGRIGPGLIDRQIYHALDFASTVGNVEGTQSLVDLGSGGGLPGLVIAEVLPQLSITLLDGRKERARALGEAIVELGWESRVQVVGMRAEEAGRLETMRGKYDMVVARAFGKPAITAECAAPLLRRGGTLFVAEPPDEERSSARWSAEGCALLGLAIVERHRTDHLFAEFRQVELCPDRYPRRVGIPDKRPLF